MKPGKTGWALQLVLLLFQIWRLQCTIYDYFSKKILICQFFLDHQMLDLVVGLKYSSTFCFLAWGKKEYKTY